MVVVLDNVVKVTRPKLLLLPSMTASVPAAIVTSNSEVMATPLATRDDHPQAISVLIEKSGALRGDRG